MRVEGQGLGWVFFFQAEDGIRDLTVTGRRVLFRSPVTWPCCSLGGNIAARRIRPPGAPANLGPGPAGADRKSTRLNSSHSQISYAVFCLKKKKKSHGEIYDMSVTPQTQTCVLPVHRL